MKHHLKPDTVVELGDAYASGTVNVTIFRHHGVLTRDRWQFSAFYTSPENLRVVRRDLRGGDPEFGDIPGDYRVQDPHCVISLGLDPRDRLHVAYDHHVHPLRYRRASEPLDIADWSGPMGMTGWSEDRVTYPYFVMWPDGASDAEGRGALDFLYRDGRSGNGDLRSKRFDPEAERWDELSPDLVRGTGQTPWPTNAYWNHPAFDARGNLVLTWVWRVHQPREGQRNFWYNHDIGYARSPDGETWHTSLGLPMNLPMTPVNAETVWPTSPGCNLMNQCSSATDSLGRLHVVFYAGDTPDAPPQYQHLWQGGDGWRCASITERDAYFDLQGKGALKLPMSRPEVVIDAADRVYVIYRGDLTGDRLVAQRLDPPDYAPPGETFVLWDAPLADAEPVLDRTRWARDGVLSLLVQYAEKRRTGDQEPLPTELAPARLVDWTFPER